MTSRRPLCAQQVWWAAAALVVTTACGDDFDPFSRLTKLRVLAIKSEPAAPATGESTTLSALVYTSPGAVVTRRHWTWCPFAGPASDGYKCQVTEAELAALGGGGEIPGFELGSGETASLANSIDPELLESVCTGRPEQPAVVDCTGGMPVTIKLELEAADESVITVRTVRLRFRPEDEANANPTIEGLSASIGGQDRPIDDSTGPPTTTLVRRDETKIHVAVPTTASESFTGSDVDGDATTEKERIITSWFVESGDLEAGRTVFIDGVTEFEEALENTWTPSDPDDYEPDTSALVVVVRDSRGGVTWQRGAVRLAEKP